MEMTLLTREQLKLAYDRDLSVSFPRDELKPFRAMERMLDRGSYSGVCPRPRLGPAAHRLLPA